MPIYSTDGEVLTDAQAQERITETIRRCGRFVMSAPIAPRIGSIQEFSGLPMKATRIITREEALPDEIATEDLWGGENLNSEDVYFEVEVAD